MRKTSLKLVAVALLFTGSIYATGTKGTDPAKMLKNQVVGILTGYHLKKSEKELVAKVTFTVNKQNEIVVLSVYSNSEKFETFVKQNLNYREVKSEGVVEGRRYTIPVRIVG